MGAVIFLCVGPNADLIRLLCALKICIAGSRGRAPGQRVRGRSPSEDETLLVYGRAMEAAILPAFSYLETKKNSQIFVSCKNDVK